MFSLPGRVPGELVSEGIARAFGGGKTTAVREERGNLSTLVMDLLNSLDGVWLGLVSLQCAWSIFDKPAIFLQRWSIPGSAAH
jgi:hypothetical protein